MYADWSKKKDMLQDMHYLNTKIHKFLKKKQPFAFVYPEVFTRTNEEYEIFIFSSTNNHFACVNIYICLIKIRM